MHFYRLIRFHIQRRFRTNPYIRVSDSGQPVTYARKLCTNRPIHKICCRMPVGSTRHYILLRNTIILYTKTFLAPACHMCKKISSETKLSHSSMLHPRALHTLSFTYIYSINSDHFSIRRNTKKSI